MKKQTATFRISEEVIEILRLLSYTSRKNKSEIVEEAVILLSKTPGEKK